MNNSFEPFLDYNVLEFLFPSKLIESFIELIKINLPEFNEDKQKRNGYANKLINGIISLFSNITCLEVYCKILIDLNFISLLQKLLTENKNEQKLVFYLLIIIKNITSIELDYSSSIKNKKNQSKFQKISNCNNLDKVFTPNFVKEFYKYN